MGSGAAKKSKSALFLIELIIAILFFALSSAVCIQLFVKAHLVSQKSSDTTMAVLHAQTAAEDWRETGGTADALLYYDAQWNALPTQEAAVYELKLLPAGNASGVERASIEVWRSGAAQPLFTMETGVYRAAR